MNDEILKKAQNIELEIAKEIKRVCEKNHLDYFISGGTLLGAVRHNGFIPWDDDIDMGMPIESFLKFIEIAPEELDDKYFLQTWDNDPFYASPIMKIKKKGTIYREKKGNNLEKDGIWVDIIPYYDWNGSLEDLKRTIVQLNNIRRILLMKCKYNPWKTENGINYKKYFGYVIFKIASLFVSKKQLISTYRNKFKKESYKASVNYKGSMRYVGLSGESNVCDFKKEWFAPFTELPFEDTSFSCPHEYDLFLEAEYGDYMQLPPIEERENRHLITEVRL